MKMRHALAGTVALPLALAVSGATQANVTIYESDTTEVTNYGRVQLQLQNQDGDNSFQNGWSRLGFGSTSQVDGGMEAFSNIELRFNPAASGNGEFWDDIRNSYLGVRGDFGQVTVGNYESVLYTNITSAADGFYTLLAAPLNGAGDNARGAAVAYQTPDIQGLTAGVSTKHTAEDADTGQDEVFNVQAWAAYKVSENLSFSFGVDLNDEDAGNDGEVKMSGAVKFAMDDMSANAVFEMHDEAMKLHLVGAYSVTAANRAYGGVTYIDNGNDTGIDIRLGADHRLSQNFVTFGEVGMGNEDATDLGDFTTVNVGARYHW